MVKAQDPMVRWILSRPISQRKVHFLTNTSFIVAHNIFALDITSILQVQCAMLYKTKTFKPKGYLTFLLVTTMEKCTIPYLATFAVTLKGKRNSWGVFIIIFISPFASFLYKVLLFYIKPLFFICNWTASGEKWFAVENIGLKMWVWLKRSKFWAPLFCLRWAARGYIRCC